MKIISIYGRRVSIYARIFFISFISCVICSNIFNPSTIFAQSSSLSDDKEKELLDLKAQKMDFSSNLLDKKIDPDTYVLGPGDVLSVFIWGNFQGQYQLPITPEGVLLIPEIGPVQVAGLTLAQARIKTADDIGGRFRNVQTVVSLVSLRKFKVFIGGAVNNPGAYPATAVSRVSEIIELAGGFLNQKEKDQNYRADLQQDWDNTKLPAKRDIKIYRANGDTLKADILRFELTGRSDFNPQMQDGDNVFVPVREKNINFYGIFGAVRNQGYFEYSERDSLADLLNIAHGLSLDADSNSVEIVSFYPDNKSSYSVFVDLRQSNWNVPLKPDDRVYVKPIQGYHEKNQVQLVGEFKYPGYYAIESDSTSLSEVVLKAGGFTEFASLQEAEMTRYTSEEVADPEFERLKKMLVADMSETEYEYFKIKSRSKPGRVSIDFEGLFVNKDFSKDIILRSGDIIYIPRKSKVITISGEVANPGLVAYVPGEDYRYYIKRSGGLSSRARKGGIAIIKGVTQEWQDPSNGKPLEPGDTIWIPEKKKSNTIALVKDIMVFVGNLATVYLVIRQATK